MGLEWSVRSFVVRWLLLIWAGKGPLCAQTELLRNVQILHRDTYIFLNFFLSLRFFDNHTIIVVISHACALPKFLSLIVHYKYYQIICVEKERKEG